MMENEKQMEIRISESSYELLKAAAELLGTSSIDELVERIISYSIEGSTPFTADQIKMLNEIKKAREFEDTEYIEDTIIFPTEFVNFYDLFLKGEWYPIAIGEARICKIKFAAPYIITPYNCISHYAEVQSIEAIPDSLLYKIIFKPDSIKELPKLIKPADRKGVIRDIKYTQVERLLQEASISAL